MKKAPRLCPCGYHGNRSERCECDPWAIRRYLGRVSGPLLDRIDLHVDIPAVEWKALRGRRGEPSRRVRERVVEARARAAHRLARGAGGPVRRATRRGTGRGRPARAGSRTRALVPPRCNAELGVRELRALCPLDARGEELLRVAVERLGLSARGCHRVIRIARTVADLAGSDAIHPDHVAEAVRYRVLDRRPAGE